MVKNPGTTPAPALLLPAAAEYKKYAHISTLHCKLTACMMIIEMLDIVTILRSLYRMIFSPSAGVLVTECAAVGSPARHQPWPEQ